MTQYTGEIQPALDANDRTEPPFSPYVPSTGLRDAVNLALYLQRPLLLEGAPGCGKTRLARAIAYDLGQQSEIEWPYYEWAITAASRIQDGLYSYDAEGRFRDEQVLNNPQLSSALSKAESQKLAKKVSDANNYIELKALGAAFEAAEDNHPAVLLIDEIDRADDEFATALLRELDRLEITITETSEVVSAAQCPPLVIITSNQSKPLPEALVRRCLYYYVDFPETDHLIEILQAHFDSPPINLVEAVLEKFAAIRSMTPAGEQLPSMNELLDWFRVLMKEPKRGRGRFIRFRKFDTDPAQQGLVLKSPAAQERFRKSFP